MKYLLPILISLCICASAHSESTNDNIAGTFEAKMGKPGNSLTILLECESEFSCTFSAISQWKNNPPLQDKQVLRKVRPVENLIYAKNALKYAMDQQYRTIKNEEYAESMSKLRPVFSSNPSISKCWDLNYPSPDYMLACTFTNAPPDSPSIYLFGTLLANCGDAFCRYVINPMSRVK